MKNIGFLVLLLGFLLTACTNEQLYNNARINEKRQCDKLPEPQYEECMESANISYEDYERARKYVGEK